MVSLIPVEKQNKTILPFSKKLPKVNNRPMDENSPHLVTLQCHYLDET
jgi:hypothetical protein